MHLTVHTSPRRGLVQALSASAIAAVLLLIGEPAATGQGLPATLTGIVSDQSGAVIPDASITLRQAATGAIRKTISNSDGYFSITAVPAGTYSLSVEHPGFNKLERTGMEFHSGDKVSLSDLQLTLASSEQKVEVVAAQEVLVPVDTGEKAHVITSHQIQNLAVLGRSADELLKILPGVVYTNPDDPGTPAGFTVQFNRGIGNYNINGTRNTQVQNTSDGANVIDPGCQCGSAVTPNVDMVQEVKVQTSNFAAENAKGPIIFNAISKSGTSAFHGEGYFYARNSIFNARDWRNNFFNTRKPEDSFYFPGFNIGGPVLIPGTSFNRNRDKLFFFAGVEWQRQNHDLGVRPATVPTLAMRKGDFSDTAYIKALNGSDINGIPMNDEEAAAAGNGWVNGGPPITTSMIKNGVISPAAIDKGGQILLNMYPLPNQDPTKANGYNYTSNIINPEHREQQLARVDYNISDSTKLYTRFNHEHQNSPYPFTLWWYNSNDVPWPGDLKGSYNTWSSSTSLVKVLNPSTTNEVVFAATYWSMPHTVQQPDKVSRKALGYPYKGLFKNGSDMLPNITDWGSGVSDIVQPGGLLNPTIFGNKWLINVSDNFSKVMATHTMKFGFFTDRITNDEPTTANDHGELSPTQWGGNSSGNAFADLLLGRVGAYDESTTNIVGNYRQKSFSFYAQDSWKATKRLTIEIGSRFEHLEWFQESNGHLFGFDPHLYNPKAPITAYTGLLANYKGDNISKSVWTAPALLFSPRLGFAFDVTGQGKTVIRGGAGVFHHTDRGGDSFGAIGNPPLRQSVTISRPITLAEIDAIDPTKEVQKSDLTVLAPNEDKIPTTYNWSFTLSKRLPWATVVEGSYVGSSSTHQIVCTNCGINMNAVPEGAMFGFPLGQDPNAYRPIQSYGAIGVRSHALSQNYNSFQLTANRQTGRFNFAASYTFSKALGVGGDSFGTYSDSFDRRHRSYGPLPYDRTHGLSIAYNYMIPGTYDNWLVKGMFAGWQLSGISQFQSGAPLTNFRYSGTLATSTVTPGSPDNFDAKVIVGTTDTSARPVMLCDPRSNLKDGQYANPACFAAPTPGHNGSYILPYMKGPMFQNHDVSVFKNFEFSESKKLQFRYSMYNFLNHPLFYFEGNDPALAMNFVNGKPDATTLAKFGTPTLKRGHRLMQFALKYYF